jgi:hypothetical protein
LRIGSFFEPIEGDLMKRVFALLTFLGLLFWGSLSFGAATCTVERDVVGSMTVIIFSWTSHTDGAVASGTCDETTSQYLREVSGMVVGIKFEPDASDAPTNLYDVTINTPGGADITLGTGTNQTSDDSVTTQWRTPLTTDAKYLTLYRENLDLVVGAAGESKKGKIQLFLLSK